MSVHSWEKEEGLHGCLDSLRTPPENLQSLELYGILSKLPEWVAGLQNLVKLKLESTRLTEVDGTIQVLGKLPNLAILRLMMDSFEDEPRYPFIFHRGAFLSLTVLDLWYPLHQSSLSKIYCVCMEFEEGTSPKLELLVAKGHIHSLSGLSCLPSLKEVVVSKYNDVNVYFVANVKHQLSWNPNKPFLKFV
jgi:hypothetical protein